MKNGYFHKYDGKQLIWIGRDYGSSGVFIDIAKMGADCFYQNETGRYEPVRQASPSELREAIARYEECYGEGSYKEIFEKESFSENDWICEDL